MHAKVVKTWHISVDIRRTRRTFCSAFNELCHCCNAILYFIYFCRVIFFAAADQRYNLFTRVPRETEFDSSHCVIFQIWILSLISSSKHKKAWQPMQGIVCAEPEIGIRWDPSVPLRESEVKDKRTKIAEMESVLQFSRNNLPQP